MKIETEEQYNAARAECKDLLDATNPTCGYVSRYHELIDAMNVYLVYFRRSVLRKNLRAAISESAGWIDNDSGVSMENLIDRIEAIFSGE